MEYNSENFDPLGEVCGHRGVTYSTKPIEKEHLEGTDWDVAEEVKVACTDCGYTEEDLLLIKYHPEPYTLNGHTLKRILNRGNYSKCCACGRILAAVSDEDFPIELFINEGKDGMVDLCSACSMATGILRNIR